MEGFDFWKFYAVVRALLYSIPLFLKLENPLFTGVHLVSMLFMWYEIYMTDTSSPVPFLLLSQNQKDRDNCCKFCVLYHSSFLETFL